MTKIGAVCVISWLKLKKNSVHANNTKKTHERRLYNKGYYWKARDKL